MPDELYRLARRTVLVMTLATAPVVLVLTVILVLALLD